MSLTEREQQIVSLLCQDPMLKAADIARRIGSTPAAVNVHLSNLGKKGVIRGRGYLLNERAPVVVIGGANLDVKARSAAKLAPATSNPGSVSMTPGGVARNVAENLARLGTPTYLITAVGRDDVGDRLLTATSQAGVRLDHVHRSMESTGTYTALLDCDGELLAAVADMRVMDDVRPELVDRARAVIASAPLLVLDGNLGPATLAHCLGIAQAVGLRTIFDPVSVAKAHRARDCIGVWSSVYAVTPNRDELAALAGRPARTAKQLLAAARVLHRRGVEHVWTRLGPRGSMLSSADGSYLTLPPYPTDVEDVTGAGDAMLAAFCHALLDDAEPADAARYGHAAAALTTQSRHTVRPDLTARLVDDMLRTGRTTV